MARLRGSFGADTIAGYGSNDRISGGYGDDTLTGNAGNDRLNGGRGNDRLDGGDGNDRIVSRSDDGEGAIAQAINANNDPNGEVNQAARMIYPNQAGLPADDVLTGGSGADLFKFDLLVNAKRAIIEKHTDPNTGAIDWAGVTGENNLVHDHWVDGIGNDVITDFNKGEGDKLKIDGHTTEVFRIDIVDADGDGQVDDTVLNLRSNQGGAGAHDKDLLGTITVLNNQLTADDFSVNAGSTAGIVRNISQINEAINPVYPGGVMSTGPGSGTGGADTIAGYGSDDRISGGYGDDTLTGNAGNDRLNGGRGNDKLDGGDGNDRIVSRSDDGEGAIAQAINANNDPNGEVNQAARMIYPGQAGLPADDILTGGSGADTFKFDLLVNAKRAIIEKHTDPNTGQIDWAGVTGENNLVHDHWVDGIGNDVITDFNKGEGDQLKIAGHTTEVFRIDVVDADGDGQADDTVLNLRSNQGGAGAHDKDLLGTITVLNNQLTADDFSVNAGSTAGIVRNISQINEAISPYNPGGGTSTDTGSGTGANTGAGASGGTGATGGTGAAGGTGGTADGTGATGGTTGSGQPHCGPAGGSTTTDATGTASGSTGGSTTGATAGTTGGGHSHGGTTGATGDGTGGSATGATGGTSGGGHSHGGATGTTGDGTGTSAGSGTAGGTSGGTAGSGTGAGDAVVSPLAELLTPPAGSTPGQAPTSGDDVMIYGAGAERGNGGMGNDLILGLEGNDSISGGWGDDRIDAGAGDDHVHGGHGNDVVAGFDGNDRLTGDSGDDVVVGGLGDDSMSGGRGSDLILGGDGADTMRGGSGNDLLMGGAGADLVNGGSGTDAVLLTGAIGDYTTAVGANGVQFTDAAGATDAVTNVEFFRFLGNDETYVIENGALTLATNTDDVDELMDDHFIQELIAAEAGEPADIGAAAAVAPVEQAQGAEADLAVQQAANGLLAA